MAGRTRGRRPKTSKVSEGLPENSGDVIQVKSANANKEVTSLRNQRTLLPREYDNELMFTDGDNDDMANDLDFFSLPPRTSLYDERDSGISIARFTKRPKVQWRKASKRRRLDESNGSGQLSPTDDWPPCDEQNQWAPETFDDSNVSMSKRRSTQSTQSTPGQSKGDDGITTQYISPPESIEFSPTMSNRQDERQATDGEMVNFATNESPTSASPQRLKFLDGRSAGHRKFDLDGDENAGGKLQRLHVYRERNRVAAKKCRSRKKAVVQKLEDTHDVEKATNDALKRQIMELRNELVSIRMEALSHTSTNGLCTCERLHRYNHEKAMELSFGGGVGSNGGRAVWA